MSLLLIIKRCWVLGLLLALGLPSATQQPVARAGQRVPHVMVVPSTANGSALSFMAKAVSFDLSGLEPDFDPIYKVVVSGTLHDRRQPPIALPDATLILSAYLEAFKPDTTPVLPDLLHPDQVATGLGGFLQGKAALVNAAGRVVYRGSMLAEIFQDSTEHLVVDLTPVDTRPNSAAVRLQGSIVLHKGGAEGGTLQALQPLTRSALAVPRGHAPSWQSVVSGMEVRKPAMLGTSGSAPRPTPTKAAPIHHGLSRLFSRTSAPLLVLLVPALGAVLVLAILRRRVVWDTLRRYW